MRRVLILCAAALSWSSSALAGEDESTPVPTTIEPALTAHISSTGFEALGDAISGVLPTGIAATGLSGEFDCDEEDPGLLLYSAEDIQIHLSTDSVVFTPTDGHLDVAVDMTLWSDDSLITLAGSCVLELDESCNLALPPTWLSIDLGIDLLLEDGGIQAQVDSVAFTHGNFGNPIDTGCILGDALETMQGYGVDVLGEVLDDVLDHVNELFMEKWWKIHESLGHTGFLPKIDIFL